MPKSKQPYQPAYAPSRTVVVYAPAEECDKDADLKRWGIPGPAVKGLGPIFVAWDRVIMHLEKAFGFLCAPHQAHPDGLAAPAPLRTTAGSTSFIS
ncbi:hypothetical protein V8C86DRAFT_3106244 [Haematococcus lacustris]